MVSQAILLLIFLGVSVTLTVRDPRRIKCAIWWGLTLLVGAVLGMSLFGTWMGHRTEQAQLVTFIALGLGMLFSILLLALLLIIGGIRLIHRESFSISHSLALVLGIVVLIYLLAFPIAVVADSARGVTLLFALGLPVGYLAFVLVSYYLYSAVYLWWAKRYSAAPEAVVVLGSGLLGDKVPPLLAARLNLGIAQYRRAQAECAEPIFVTSGGQGPGETIPEGRAMGRYALAHGVPDVMEELESVSTETNLAYTRVLLPEANPWIVATSDYHAFRAAVLMRELKIPGNAVGAKTPRYFWAAAFLREYVAVLRRHMTLNAVMLILASVPLILLTVTPLSQG